MFVAATILVHECSTGCKTRRVRIKGNISPIDCREDRLQAVIVFLRDWIELVMMALGAMGGESQECSDGVADHIIAIKMTCDLSVEL